MAISVETSPTSTRTYSGVINSVLIQTEDGRQFDSGIKNNRIRDHSTDYYHHFGHERPRLFARPLMLLGLAIFVAVWLFSESSKFGLFPLTASNHKFGEAKVENLDNGDEIDTLYDLGSLDGIDALIGDDDVQLYEEQLVILDENSTNSSTDDDDDDDVLGEDDNFEGDGAKMQNPIVETNFTITTTNNENTTIDSIVNATKDKF